MKKLFIIFTILLSAFVSADAEELAKINSKYPDYAYIYLGPDKYEKINRKGRFSVLFCFI